MRIPAIAPIALVLLVLVAGFRYQQDIPALTITQVSPALATPVDGAVDLPWPDRGAAAIGIEGLGVVSSIGDEQARPIASVSKMMTAYVILKNHPLQPGERGPSVTITAADVADYNTMFAQDQSVVPVNPGTQISQYDLLQGLLIASANNYAAILARWDAGSIDAFVQKMNAEAAALGMSKTRYADASGFSAASRSTATEQVLLAQNLMASPVAREIVAKRQVTLPGAGTVSAVNAVLGQQGIVGIKTGWTEEAGGCFVFAAKVQVQGKETLVFGAVLGQETRPDAFATSLELIPAMAQAIKPVRVVAEDAVVAEITSDWGEEALAVADESLEAFLWPGTQVETELRLDKIKAPIKPGQQLGSLLVSVAGRSWTVPVRAETGLDSAGVFWRVLR